MQMHLYVPVEEAQLLEILSTLSKSGQVGPIAEKSHLFETSRAPDWHDISPLMSSNKPAVITIRIEVISNACERMKKADIFLPMLCCFMIAYFMDLRGTYLFLSLYTVI